MNHTEGVTRSASALTAKLMAGLLAVLLGIICFLGIRAILILREGEDFNNAPRATTAEAVRVLDPEGFLVAWSRSEESTYAIAGTRRLEGSGVAIESVYVRVQDATRRLEREGPTAILEVDGTERSCDQFGDDWRCSGATVAASFDDRVNGIRRLVEGDAAPYSAIREPTGCYKVTAKTVDDASGPFGSTSLICFDTETGAIRRTDTVRGQRTETLELSELRSAVSDADFVLKVAEP